MGYIEGKKGVEFKMRYHEYRALWGQLFIEALKEAGDVRADGCTTTELLHVFRKKLEQAKLSWNVFNPNASINEVLWRLKREGLVTRKERFFFGYKKVIFWKYIGGEKDGTK